MSQSCGEPRIFRTVSPLFMFPEFTTYRSRMIESVSVEMRLSVIDPADPGREPTPATAPLRLP
ncbi:MAG TPA: hypothetical protein VK912_09300 [Longimicrobiales bacterium]|nr:hypothetical protein [Longimicrobiales bacterium]